MTISIRPFSKDDILYKIEWVNDSVNNKYLHYDLPLEYDKTVAWYERAKDRKDRFDATILLDGIPVGLIGLLNVDRLNQKAEYYILLGDPQQKKKGVATRASKLLLQYGFTQLGLNRIYLYTEVENIPAQKLFEKIGFVKEGVLRSEVRSHGRFADRFIYGMLREDWIHDACTRP